MHQKDAEYLREEYWGNRRWNRPYYIKKNWNILCRWALCYSLSEKTLPTDIPIASDSNLEMSWLTFGGDYFELYEALVKAWCIRMKLPTDDETVVKYFRLNLERGIAHLCGTGFIKNYEDLVKLAMKVK